MRTSSLLFFPDGWTLRPIGGLTGLHYLCPVRTCQRDFNRLSRLKKHFKASPLPFLLLAQGLQ